MLTTDFDIRAAIPTYAMPVALLIVIALFGILAPVFLTTSNFTAIVYQMSITGIMAVCMTFVIMTGGIDLSVGPVLATSGLVVFYFLHVASFPLIPAVILGITAGAITGAISGAIISFFSLPAMIVTLGMLSIIRGSALLAGGPDLHLVRNQPGFDFIGNGYLLGIPFAIWLFVIVSGLLIFIQRKTTFGLQVAAIGDNQRAAYLSGRKIRLVKTMTYMICGMGAALAGIVQSSQVHTAAATYGEFGTELDVIAAVVLGGASLLGGKGSVARTIMGVLFLAVLNNGFNILNVPIDYQLIIKGGIIVLALSMTEWANTKIG
ncbi:ABC transporter permease [Cohaesibacter celericrescens]|uniref:Ribose ABC transporter permease n=1 Tax=Cohaesibacter celericrescens TaxID=2067669 RepID=A0A2N5XMR0_9HYPH|nr:ABC transporter permease [Cohaesibacter celericrescens]PLW75730.1 ribose ABC transporter permease [Cohaesibacter celericrescens]